MAKINEKAIEYIRKIPPPFRVLIEQLRSLILDMGKGVNISESFQNKKPVYKIEDKPYFYIEKLPKRHIRLGIYNKKAENITDESDVNQIEIRSKKDIETLGIADLIEKRIRDL
jgi:hypothetical protein